MQVYLHHLVWQAPLVQHELQRQSFSGHFVTSLTWEASILMLFSLVHFNPLLLSLAWHGSSCSSLPTACTSNGGSSMTCNWHLHSCGISVHRRPLASQYTIKQGLAVALCLVPWTSPGKHVIGCIKQGLTLLVQILRTLKRICLLLLLLLLLLLVQ